MAAAVVRDGKMVWRHNFGEADAESHAPVTDQTLFPIASISKTMAAVVIMQLVNEGKLKLSDPITKYRPELPFPPTITIERIMSHTAEGIPGEEFLYSGALYGLLTGVIERVEHKPYAQVLNERIFHPLQMNDTFAGLPADKSAANTKSVASRIATGYQLDPQTHEAAPLSIDLSRISTATGVISDIGDLAKYAAALDTDKLVATRHDGIDKHTAALDSRRDFAVWARLVCGGVSRRTNRLALRPRAQLFESVCARTIETSHFHHAREFRRAKRCAAAQRW